MSKKKPAKKAAPKSKPAKSTAPPVETPPVGECARGGDHDWTEEGDERFCAKCKEPQPTKATRKSKAEPSADKQLSAVDAAAKLLAETKEPLTCKAMIEGIAAKGWWTSPGGKTPHATLYSAIIREIFVRGNDARFVKTERGKFASKR